MEPYSSGSADPVLKPYENFTDPEHRLEELTRDIILSLLLLNAAAYSRTFSDDVYVTLLLGYFLRLCVIFRSFCVLPSISILKIENTRPPKYEY
jgi:hypothetical protein